MSRGRPTVRPVTAVRIMALLCVVLALICAGLAAAWSSEREEAACWRIAAEFQRQPEGGCPS
jgi:hypothetical protein